MSVSGQGKEGSVFCVLLFLLASISRKNIDVCYCYCAESAVEKFHATDSSPATSFFLREKNWCNVFSVFMGISLRFLLCVFTKPYLKTGIIEGKVK